MLRPTRLTVDSRLNTLIRSGLERSPQGVAHAVKLWHRFAMGPTRD